MSASLITGLVRSKSVTNQTGNANTLFDDDIPDVRQWRGDEVAIVPLCLARKPFHLLDRAVDLPGRFCQALAILEGDDDCQVLAVDT